MQAVIEAKVAAIIDDTTLVLNAGLTRGVREGMAFVIVAEHAEIRDPDSGDSLGRWEVVKARVIVTHVQDTMCTVRAPAEAAVVVGDTRPLSTLMAEQSVGRTSGWQRFDVRSTERLGSPQARPIALGDCARSLVDGDEEEEEARADGP